MSFQSRLKERREYLKISRADMAKSLNVTVGAISNYENGVSSPKVDLLFKIFEILNCDANYLYQDSFTTTDFRSTFDEQSKIKKYRTLDRYGKEVVDLVLDKEFERIQDIKEFDKLEQAQRRSEIKTGTEHAMESTPIIHTVTKTEYLASFSAGTGLFVFDDVPTQTIEVPCEFANTDFVIGVNGDSMETTYSHGDKVMVQKCESIDIGQIGLFMVDGEGFIKECGGDRLISHNKKYPDILLKEHRDIRCIGKVIGKLD